MMFDLNYLGLSLNHLHLPPPKDVFTTTLTTALSVTTPATATSLTAKFPTKSTRKQQLAVIL